MRKEIIVLETWIASKIDSAKDVSNFSVHCVNRFVKYRFLLSSIFLWNKISIKTFCGLELRRDYKVFITIIKFSSSLALYQKCFRCICDIRVVYIFHSYAICFFLVSRMFLVKKICEFVQRSQSSVWRGLEAKKAFLWFWKSRFCWNSTWDNRLIKTLETKWKTLNTAINHDNDQYNSIEFCATFSEDTLHAENELCINRKNNFCSLIT